ncbi:hypothetical protein [Sorangium sp. So ce1000]|uniref:hypothetical protein n=1 Tax=Sorangium sp. So ce1000 TaxID=3133325 RepID=UPI003F63431F
MISRIGNHSTRAFQAAIALGILVDLAMAVPSILSPGWMLSALSLPPVLSFKADVWIRYAGALLLALSIMYVPAAVNPSRHRFNAAVAVIARLGFGLFWYWLVTFADYPAAFLGLGYVDVSIGAVQAILYVALLRREYLRPATPAPGAR